MTMHTGQGIRRAGLEEVTCWERKNEWEVGDVGEGNCGERGRQAGQVFSIGIQKASNLWLKVKKMWQSLGSLEEWSEWI